MRDRAGAGGLLHLGSGPVLVAVFILICLPMMGIGATLHVSSGGSNLGTGEAWSPLRTIQAAIDMASAGDTILVGPGTYVEDLTILKDNLTVGPWDEAVVTIKGIDTVADGLWPLADPNIDIQANGVSIHHVTIESPDVPDGQYSSGIVLTGQNIELHNNTFVQLGTGAGYGVAIQTYHEFAIPGSDIGGLSIHDNEFQGTPGGDYVPIYVNYTASTDGAVTIEDNVMTGNVFYVVTERSGTIIRNNTIARDSLGGSAGIRVQDFGVATPHAIQDVLISGNRIENFASGFRTGSSDTLTNTTITGNVFVDNTIQIRDDSGSLDISAVLAANSFDRAVCVDHPGNSLLSNIWSSIQAAIDSSVQSDSVLVESGTYHEQVTIDKPLTLTGSGSGSTVIDGGNAGVVVTIAAGNSYLGGFAVQGAGTNPDAHAGIALVDVEACSVRDCDVSGNINGIALMGANGNTIENCTIASSGAYGVVLEQSPYTSDYSTGNTVSSCQITGSGLDGIYAGADCDGQSLTGNTISGTLGGSEGNGIYFWKSSSNVVTGNTIADNSQYGVELMGSANNVFTGNTVSGNVDGFHIRKSASYASSPNTIHGNSISGNSGYGVFAEVELVQAVDAIGNWWGTANGPAHANNTYNVGAQGNAVSDNVSFVRWLDGPSGVPFAVVTKNSDPTYYASIQAAIDSAAVGDTIVCASGTFTEDIALDVADLELQGAGATTIIQGVARTASGEWPNATANIDVRGAGCVLHDFTARNPEWMDGFYSSGMIIGAQDVEVHHVAFEGPTSDDLDDLSQTFQNWRTVDISGLNLHDCVFTTLGGQLYGYEAVYVNPESGTGMITIADNVLGGNLFRGITTERRNVTISGNTIVTTADPANAWAGINVDANDVTVTGNTVAGTSGFDVGIDIASDAATVQDIVVNNNTVGPGNDTGIRVRGDLQGTGVDARHNDIAGNLTWGIDAATITGLAVNAIECWWGDVNGPAGEGSGAGDAVSMNVDFAPWLNASGGTPVARPEVTQLDVVQSLEKATWYGTEGDWAGGFWMTLDPDQDYQYLDVRELAATAPLEDGYHEFFLNQAALPAGFFAYWAARGVDGTNNTGGWELQMWEIINGRDPMFFLRTGTGDPMLVDGLQHLLGQPDDFLRVNGDYPAGTYTFTGTITETNGIESAPFDVVMTFYRAPDVSFGGFPIGSPDFVVGGAFGEFRVAVDNTQDGADYADVVYEVRIQGPAGQALTPDMIRLQKEGSWVDVTLTQDGDDLVGLIGPSLMNNVFAEQKAYRLKAQLGAPAGDFALVFSVNYTTPDPDWVLREAQQAFTVGGQASAGSTTLESGWSMVSVAFVPDDNVPETVFADVITSGQPLVIFEYVDGGYIVPSEIDPGNGYWIYLFAPVTIDVVGDLVSGVYAVPLGAPGWHQISCPKWPVGWSTLEFEVAGEVKSFADAASAGWVVPVAYSYDTSSGMYVAADVAQGAMDPWTAYWFYTVVDAVTLRMPMDAPYIPVGPTALSRIRPTAEQTRMRPPAPPMLKMDAETLGLDFGNSPNPIRDVHTTTFFVKGGARDYVDAIRVEIFDQTGRMVYTHTEEGTSFDWHTDNDYGEYLANGVYLYKLYARVDGTWIISQTKKLAIVR